jgi:hypothetical protein
MQTNGQMIHPCIFYVSLVIVRMHDWITDAQMLQILELRYTYMGVHLKHLFPPHAFQNPYFCNQLVHNSHQVCWYTMHQEP